MRTPLVVIAAIGLSMAATSVAHADPVPEWRCTTNQLLLDVKAQVCLGVVGEYPNGVWRADAWLQNTGSVPYEGGLRVDLVFPKDTVYGQLCTQQLPAGSTMFCNSKTDGRSDAAPQGRALVIKPGYSEAMTVNWW